VGGVTVVGMRCEGFHDPVKKRKSADLKRLEINRPSSCGAVVLMQPFLSYEPYYRCSVMGITGDSVLAVLRRHINVLEMG
jgi:hypothetical protein